MSIVDREYVTSMWGALNFRPVFTAGVMLLGVVAALLEGIGLSFILPIIKFARETNGTTTDDGFVRVFVDVYEFVGVPFTLENVVVGVVLVMALRYSVTFLIGWARARLRMDYERDLKRQTFEQALYADVAFFDEQGSDDLLNAIVTQAKAAGKVISRLLKLFEQAILVVVYLGISMLVSVRITVVTLVILGGITALVRYVIEPAYAVGDEVAEANERIQEAVQAGTQGIRDVKLYGLLDEMYDEFESWLDRYADGSVRISRNKALINNFYNFVTAVTIFVLIYVALRFTSMSVGSLGIFLFAMFRLAPRVSILNDMVYSLEANLPHLIRTESLLADLRHHQESLSEGDPLPAPPEELEFDDVSFAYTEDEQTLRGIDFSVTTGEFVAFVGKSGAGKSTIAALAAGLYTPDDGEILVDGRPLTELSLEDWRSEVAVVRQKPFLFNDTLRYNVTVGAIDATKSEIQRACEIAQVTEFLDELPEGYDTQVGDDGVRLSGGQRQRVALARALLKDARILILDEATSDLDTTIEMQVQSAIESMDEEYLVLTIAHRLSTVQNADRIYTLRDGEIIERGPHGALIEADGEYAELYATQGGA